MQEKLYFRVQQKNNDFQKIFVKPRSGRNASRALNLPKIKDFFF